MSEPLLAGTEPPEPVRQRRADAMARADRAWRVRVVGGTWQEAADAAGFANDANAIRAVRDTFGSLPEVDRQELRALWRDRLEALWRQALRDALDRQPGALVAAVRVMQAAARLDGLEAPTQMIVHNPPDAEIEAWVVAMLSTGQPELEEEADILGEIEE
jgi:AraC-like DNA-binding protein